MAVGGRELARHHAGQFVTEGSGEQPDGPGWKLAFHDEFDGAALDLKKWNPNDPWGYERNHELQAYVTSAFEVKDGVLRIRAEKREAFYRGKQRAYTSVMMTTYRKFSQ
jgi:beta-glucanase (GH16 family)